MKAVRAFRFAAAAVVTIAGIVGISSAEDLPSGPQSPVQQLALADMANPDLREAAGHALPLGWVLGRLYRLDETAGKALFAAFPAGADTPFTPGNAFDPGKTIEVALVRKDGRFTASGARVYPRPAADVAAGDADQADLLMELYAAAQSEGASGNAVCRIRGWATSEASSGTAVRKAPSDDAPIAGRLAPPHVSDDTDASSIDGWRAEFEITGYRDGWFRIANATAPGAAYDDPPPEDFPRTYSGSGWVRATEVAAAYANTGMPVPQLLQYPNVDAQPLPPGEAAAGYDGDLAIDTPVMRLHACSANWALTTSRDGQRGWWRGTCSDQATNCS